MITPSPGDATSSAPPQAASGISVLTRRSVRKVDIENPLRPDVTKSGSESFRPIPF
jgi:hypothetical protein